MPVGPLETFEGLEPRWWGAGRLPEGMDLKSVQRPGLPGAVQR